LNARSRRELELIHKLLEERPAEGGFDAGVFEIALPYRGEAYRTVYAVQLGSDLWVLHAFQKKSKTAIKTQRRRSICSERACGG
jgi:phage-related protein